MEDFVLVLPSWYPSKSDAFNGDFNERLVHAISPFQNQIVLYVDFNRKNKGYELEIITEKNIISYKAYFKYSKYPIFNLFNYLFINYRILKKIFIEYGLPKFVHTYVFFPAGLISIYLKYRFKLKIILTEHWSLFNEKSKRHFDTYSYFQKASFKLILNSFDCIITVGDDLAKSVNRLTPNIKKGVIFNVVDSKYFFFEEESKLKDGLIHLIHVSDMGNHKNVLSILKVIKQLLIKGYPLNLTLVGKERKGIIDFIQNDIDLKSNVNFLGEIEYVEVASEMKKADVFILFSIYENMPCVILEALCCGLPVISSNIGGISEVINAKNGLLVESENEKSLEKAIIQMMSDFNKYDGKSIAENSKNEFSYEVIGKRMNEIYTAL